MKKTYLILFAFSFCIGFSQVGIGTASPDNSSILDISSTDKGVLVPRVSLSNTNVTMLDGTNSSPTSLLIWNTNSAVVGGNGIGFYYFNGTVWVKIDQNTNTLDQAYDQGGAGAGRTIVADSNPVRINGTDGVLVTGTFGSGATPEVSGAGTRMFFNPRKAAFRAGFVSGTQWDDSAIGNYSFASGRNTRATGLYSFAANDETLASGESASSFGNLTTASGKSSAAFGNGSISSGENSFAGGTGSVSAGTNSFAFGNYIETPSFAEAAFGQFNTTYTPASATSFNALDRVFSVGIGTAPASRKDALEVFKDGRVRINNAYTLPTTDGTANQVLTTNGAGVVSWEVRNNPNITAHTLYADQGTITESNLSFATVNGANTSCIPTLFNSSGNVQVKVIIRYTAISGTNQFRLRRQGTTAPVFADLIAETDTWTNTSFAPDPDGIIESQWKNWSGATNPAYSIYLQQRYVGSGSITIANVYVLVKSQ